MHTGQVATPLTSYFQLVQEPKFSFGYIEQPLPRAVSQVGKLTAGECWLTAQELVKNISQSSVRQKTCTSPGPCIPTVRVISMSAVREGPLINAAAVAWRMAGCFSASARLR